jgi:hypothetical protein
LVPEGFFEVCHFFVVATGSLTRLGGVHFLLLHQHILLHCHLLKLASEPEALVDVHCQFDFDFVCLG